MSDRAAVAADLGAGRRPTPEQLAEGVRDALRHVIDPEIRRPLTELNMVSRIEVDDDAKATVTIRLTTPGCPNSRRITEDVRAAVAAVPGVADTEVVVDVMTPEQRQDLIVKLRGKAATRGIPFTADGPTRVYAVTSGKGGVGKSTITANLAVALAADGLKVGLLDADVFGFSIPAMLGLAGTREDGSGWMERPTRVDDMILPPIAHEVKAISIGMFVEDRDAAVAWRGPMLHRTVKQFLTDVHYDELDVLLVDMPPGTGDIAITVGQLLPHADVIVVTTPQTAAADVAVRSGAVGRQTGQTVYGVIENMAGWAQPDGSVIDLFGSGGGAEVARRLSHEGETVPVLGSVPLSVALREGGDAGVPVVVGAPDDPAAVAIRDIARAMASRAALVAAP